MIPFVELIKQTWKLYQNNFSLFVKYILISLVPGFAMFLLTMVIAPGFFLMKLGNVSAPFMVVLGILLAIIALAIIIVVIFFSLLFNFAFIRAAYLCSKNQEVGTMKENLTKTNALVWKGLSTSILTGIYIILPLLIVLSGFAIFGFLAKNLGATGVSNSIIQIIFVLLGIASVVYAIYMSIRLQFAVYETLFSDLKTKLAIKSSSNLVKNHWWAVFGRIIGTGILLSIALYIIGAILLGIGSINIVLMALFSLINWIVSLLVWPMMLLVSILVYNSLKDSTVPEVK